MLNQLQHIGTTINVKKNEFLFHCDDEVTQFYFVIDGEIRALRYQKEGKASIMMRSVKGEFFSSSSLSLSHYPCAAIASCDSQVLAVAKKDFEQALQNSALLAQAFALSLAKDLKKQCGRVERLRLPTAKERILHYIACETADSLTLNLTTSVSVWADELGIEPESVYRALKKMQTEGVIKKTKNSIVVL